MIVDTKTLKAEYGDPLTFRTVESDYEWQGDNRWLLHITKIRTMDDKEHEVRWTKSGHTDDANHFVFDEWTDGQGDYHEVVET